MILNSSSFICIIRIASYLLSFFFFLIIQLHGISMTMQSSVNQDSGNLSVVIFNR